MRFEEPDADWTDDYPWTRYRGPQPYPAPEDWVLDIVEADGVLWYRYPETGHKVTSEADYQLDDDLDFEWAPTEEREEMAMLGDEWPPGADVMGDDPYHELKIDGELVLVLKSVHTDEKENDWWTAVAEALARYSRDESYQTVLPDLGLEHLKAEPFEDDDLDEVPEPDVTLGDFSEKQ